MTRIDCDIAVLGSGFGGTLLAIIARKLGYATALLERGAHPRFAIGESSTPLADFKLAAIADRFGLDWLRPFSKYGTWKASYPQVRCGLKRGFSFFRHEPGRPFTPQELNANSLLVAASPDDARSDTHWFRADFDAHLVDRAVAAGVTYLDRLEIEGLRREHGWHLDGTRSVGTSCQLARSEAHKLAARGYDTVGTSQLVASDAHKLAACGYETDSAVEIHAGFLVDATGDGQMLGRSLGLEPIDPKALLARSRALYSHFTGVARWHDVLEETHGRSATAQHTFPCDAAAQHQLIDGGWMWVLRFDHGVTSAGFSLDPEVHPIRAGESPEAEWQRLLNTYPSLARQFAAAQAVRPFVRTGRLQRRWSRAAGADWALLPHAAGFLDAWLSPGIAQTLFAVEWLGRTLAEDWRGPRREVRLAEYGQAVLRELAWVDEITGTCFACFDRFEVMVPVSMLYFVAAHYCEERERAGQAPADAAFLLADEEAYRRSAAAVCRQALTVSAADADAFAASVRRALEPYNLCCLCNPERCNMYPFTGSK